MGSSPTPGAIYNEYVPDLVIGNLKFTHVKNAYELLGDPVRNALANGELDQYLDEIYVAPIDPTLADTAQFCNYYKIGLEVSANTIVVEAKRADKKWYALCNILATTKADINKIVRKHLDAKRTSFASMEFATQTTKMEYGGIGPIGAPKDWPLLIDSRVLEPDFVVIGSGLRNSKIAIPGKVMDFLPGAQVLDGMAIEL